MADTGGTSRIKDGSLASCGVAVAAAAVAIIVRLLMDPFLTGVQFITFFPAAMIVAYFCGSRAALLTTLLLGFAGWFLLLEPAYSFKIPAMTEAISLTTFLVISSVMSLSIGGMQAALARERQHHERQQLLIDELNHRVKNNLTLVQAIARQTLKAEACSPEVRKQFEDRLIALATAHEILSHENWEKVRIEALVKRTLGVLSLTDHRVRLTGRDAVLEPKTAVAMTLAIHELATNAIKYGALSVPEGSVDVTWGASDGRLHFEWCEKDGPTVTAPSRGGFGSTMIRRALAREFGGEVTLDFRPEGVLCRIDAPIDGAAA